LAALREVLSRDDVGGGELTVVLSNHFVHYLLLPWRAELGQPAELVAFAALCFDEAFGIDGARALLTSHEGAPSPRVAAALDVGFLAGLRAAAGDSRLRLVSIAPYLAAVYNRVRGSLAARDFMLVVAEPGRSCLMLASRGCWRSLRNTATIARPRELANLIEREAQLAGLAEEGMPPIFVHAPGQDALQLPSCHGVRPQLLSCARAEVPAASGHPLLAMALAVA
jgi:hypothetical protein